MSDSGFYDRIEEVVDKDDVHDLYRFWADYVEHCKAESRRRR